MCTQVCAFSCVACCVSHHFAGCTCVDCVCVPLWNQLQCFYFLCSDTDLDSSLNPLVGAGQYTVGKRITTFFDVVLGVYGDAVCREVAGILPLNPFSLEGGGGIMWSYATCGGCWDVLIVCVW